MLKYRVDLAPVLFIAALFVLDLVIFFSPLPLAVIVVWMVISSVLKVFSAAWNHNHQHVSFFRSTLLNRVIEFMLALQTGITTNAWVIHHNDGHHTHYLDQTRDPSRWRTRDGKMMGPLGYTVRLACTAYTYVYQNAVSRPKLFWPFLYMTVLSVVCLIGLLWYDPLKATLIFVVPLLISYLMTCFHTFDHHRGLSEDDPYKASYNILNRNYNRLTGNLGFHTAHHLRPGLHWSKLPQFHAQIAHRIPKENYRDPGRLMELFPE